MPRLVTKFGYLKQGKRKSPGGYARYIATREGVEKLTDSQQKTYADYIATRPRAERLGSHGLFTDEGDPVILSRVSKELNEYKGNIYTAILSLRREDAERLGFDSALRWRDFLRGQTQTIAENLKIPLNHLRWYAAFHNEGYHPHVHMIAYSTVPGEGYLTEKGVEKIRSVFANEIFQQDLLCTYQKQTQYRDQLRSQGRETVAEIVKQINSGSLHNERIETLLVQLSDKLSCTTGKKVYGYLKPETKAIINEIVTELSRDSRIKKLYDLWYEQREDVLRTYTDHFPERIPLEQNPEFKSIRNAVIQEAMNLLDTKRYYENTYGIRVDFGEKPGKKKAPPGKPPDEQEAQEAPDMSRITPRISVAPTASIPQVSPVFRVDSAITAQASLRLLQNLSRLIEQKYQQEQREDRPTMDRKQRREIAEKKQALGLRD